MAEKKKTSRAKDKVTERVTRVLNQARESLKLLGTLEKETLAKARSFVRIPSAAERKRMRNERILSGLQRVGVATQNELANLEKKVHRLETALGNKKSTSSTGKGSKAAGAGKSSGKSL